MCVYIAGRVARLAPLRILRLAAGGPTGRACACVCACACVRACVRLRACVRACGWLGVRVVCVRVRARTCVSVRVSRGGVRRSGRAAPRWSSRGTSCPCPRRSPARSRSRCHCAAAAERVCVCKRARVCVCVHVCVCMYVRACVRIDRWSPVVTEMS
jgi:hypothetical protein